MLKFSKKTFFSKNEFWWRKMKNLLTCMGNWLAWVTQRTIQKILCRDLLDGMKPHLTSGQVPGEVEFFFPMPPDPNNLFFFLFPHPIPPSFFLLPLSHSPFSFLTFLFSSFLYFYCFFFHFLVLLFYFIFVFAMCLCICFFCFFFFLCLLFMCMCEGREALSQQDLVKLNSVFLMLVGS